MAQVNAGRVRFIGRGEYDNSTQYYTFDLVNYNGNSYFAKSNTMGNLPTNSTYWQLVAEKGNVGPTGPTGNGIDHISLTSQSGATKVYTIYFTDGNTTTFIVQDGEVTQEVFDEEIDRLKMVYNALPSDEETGESITIDGTAEVPFREIGLKGNTSQNGEPTPETPQDIQVVSGNNTIIVSNSNNTQSQSYSISLRNIELCKIGDYQDRIYKQSDKWYLEKNTEKVVLDGTWDNITLGTSSTNTTRITFNSVFNNNAVGVTTLAQYCNRLLSKNLYSIDEEGFYASASSSHDIVVRINKSTIGTTNQQVNAYLSQNNLIIYFAIQTPTTTEITDSTLINQLNNLEKAYSYDEQTNISQTNNDLPFIITAEAILSLKNILNI